MFTIVLRKLRGRTDAVLAPVRGAVVTGGAGARSGGMLGAFGGAWGGMLAIVAACFALAVLSAFGVPMLGGGEIEGMAFAAAGATAAQQQRAPFRMGTRQRRAKVGTIPYAEGGSNSINLPRVGMLSQIIVQFRGTVTGPGAITDLGPWNLISRFRVNTNIGSASLVDLSGYGAFLVQRLLQRTFAPNAGDGVSLTPSADIHAAPVGAGAQTWVLTWVIPIGANRGPNFEAGLINLQAPEISVTFEPTFGALLDPATTVTAIAGNLHVYYEYYEIPDPTQFAMPPLTLVRLLEEQQAIGQTGENIYTVPRMGTLLQLIHRVNLNGARSDSFDSTAIRFNKTDSVYTDERQELRILERLQFGTSPLTGIVVRDLWGAYDAVSMGDTRDAIDSEQLTTLESVVTVSSAAVLGANNNFLASIRRIMQTIG